MGMPVVDEAKLIRDLPAPGLETVKFVPQVSAFGFGGAIGSLHQSCLEIDIALERLATWRDPGGLCGHVGAVPAEHRAVVAAVLDGV